ncbi:hypothetical protein Hanom_Chr03g00272961 [Helianthus anomalus]
MLNFFPRSICLFLATAASRCVSSQKSTYANPFIEHKSKCYQLIIVSIPFHFMKND